MMNTFIKALNKNRSGFLMVLFILCLFKTNAQTVLIDPNTDGGFELGAPSQTFALNSWNTIGSGGERWYCSGDLNTQSVTCSGSNGAAYISNIGSLTTPQAYTLLTATTCHLYRDITFPAGEGEIVLNFNYKGRGDGTTGLDGVKLYFGSSSILPVAGTLFTASDVSAIQYGNTIYNNKTVCTPSQIILPPSFAGTTKRIVFSWINNGDGIGTNTSPLSIDDISLTSKILVLPGCASILAPANLATTVCLNAVTLKWFAPTSLGLPTGYTVSYGLTVSANDFTFSPGNVFSYNIGNLAANTTYYWKVVPSNSLGSASGCPVWSFTTGGTFPNPNPAITPVFTDFEDCSIWTIRDTLQTNKWVIGSATNNGGSNSIYISDNDGAINQYSSISSGDPSVVHFYKDIAFPSGQACIVLKFDLRTLGDSSLDFVPSQLANSDNLRIYSDTAGVAFTPSAGNDPKDNGMGASVGVKLLAEYYNKSNYTAITLVLNPLWAGTTKRIIFTWRNNGKDFLQTPAAIDNISIITSVQPAPNCVNIIYPANGLSDLCDAGQILNWQPNVSGCNKPTSYKIYFGTDTNTIPLVSTVTGNTFTYTTGVLLPGTAYYWRIVPLTGAIANTSCPFSYFTTSATGVVNNFPCNAINVPLGASIDGYNGCTNTLNEPALPLQPSQWTLGALNTVWYKAICPASGKLNIRIVLSTLTQSQIAVYQGTCSSLTLVPGAYNVASSDVCGSNPSPLYSELKLTGLTAGSTYYVVVDGRQALVGDFSILIVDGGLAYPGSLGQDCILPLIPCNQTTKNFNPGFSSYGFLCDIPTAYLNPPNNPVEENNSTWYVLNIQSAGTLSFNIVPNDFGNPNPYTMQGNPSYIVPGNEANYNFALWKFDGSPVNCATIAAHSTPPLKKNTSPFGTTGLSATGNAPIAYGLEFDAAYETSVTVAAGEIYYLLVTNNTIVPNIGFTIDFLTSPINYSIAAVAVTWTGGSNNGNWTLAGNWGGCEVPDCPIDATIISSPINQPSLTAGTYKVKNLTIDAGAKLILGASSILEICGDFENNGTIQADITSEIIFKGTSNQTIGGIGGFSLLNKLGKLTITKTSGTVFQNANIEVAGAFKNTNATSIFNTNGNALKLGGNFINTNGSASFIDPIGTSILEFYGVFGQTYADPLATTGISNIKINKTSTAVAVTLLSNMKLAATSTLTLSKGIISTNAFEVNVTNPLPASLIGGSDTSYVIGNLRRSIAATGGSYNFPVGHVTKLYQLANIDFTTATTIPSLLARFDIWTPYTFPISPTECAVLFNAPAMNNGYWTITASANPTSGTYNTTLYPKNVTNLGLSRSIIKSSTSVLGPWSFNGVCDTVNTSATKVRRTGMNGFSLFAIGQGAFPLPVELLSFSGKKEQNYNLLQWTTATEINNNYFEIERSTNGDDFEKIGELDGQGNSTTLVNYSFKDSRFSEKINYYRLKQIDFDGNYTYSDAIAIDNSIKDLSSLSIMPNPFKNEFKVEIETLSKGNYIIEIYNLMGQLVMKQSIECETRGCSTIFNTESLNAGTYCVKVLSENRDYISAKIAIKN